MQSSFHSGVEAGHHFEGSTQAFVLKEQYWRFDEISLDMVKHCVDGWTLVSCPSMAPCPRCGSLGRHTDAIVIAVGGACRNNGRSHPIASAGVTLARETTSMSVCHCRGFRRCSRQ